MPKDIPADEPDRTELVAYLDGELEPGAARRVEEKLSRDAGLRSLAEELRRTWQFLDYLPQSKPSPAFASQTVERISALRPVTARQVVVARKQPWAWIGGWAAAMLVAGSLGYLGMTRLAQRKVSSPPPVESEGRDEQMVRDLRILENRPLYERIPDLAFLRELDSPDLFGDES
jgi:anti-sigma factor RsiW